jgi:hypothetical protein
MRGIVFLNRDVFVPKYLFYFRVAHIIDLCEFQNARIGESRANPSKAHDYEREVRIRGTIGG